MKKNSFIIVFILLSAYSYSQIGIGTVGGLDFYQRYKNPVDNIASPSSGNAVLNLIWGPKIWLGKKNVSFSLETQINLGLTSFSIKDYKGLGSVAFPIIAKLNFKGLSGFYPGFSKGISIGAGMQWSKTELFYLSKSYKNKGVNRKFIRTYVVQIDLGYGSFGSSGIVYVRYGKNFDDKSSTLNVGFIYNINKTFVKKNIEYKRPEKK